MNRVAKLQQAMKDKDIDLCIFAALKEDPNTNMVYFTGYKGLGILLVMQHDHVLLAPQMEWEKAQKTGCKVISSEKKRGLFEVMEDFLQDKIIKKTGIEYQECSVALFKKCKKIVKGRFTDISLVTAQVRMTKEEEELQKLTYACEVTSTIFNEIIADFTFTTEGEIRQFILKRIADHGCTPAFPPIVASAQNSSMPHYEGDSTLTSGFLLFDFGAKYQGYHADMSRTIFLGNPTGKEREHYQLVLTCLESCEQQSLTKKKFGQLYDHALRVLGDQADYFTHALGHGVGLEIHELPNLYTTDKHIITKNIPFTIEPGIYFPGNYGIRIEDTLYLNDKGLTILTTATKDLLCVNISKKN